MRTLIALLLLSVAALAQTANCDKPEDCVSTSADTFQLSHFDAPKELVIVGPDDNDPMVRINLKTGVVKFGASYKPDAAVEAFWQALAGDSPQKLKAEIAELKKQLEEVNKSLEGKQ